MNQKFIKTEDGVDISINEFNPLKGIEPKFNIVIAPATAITQRFYKDLALFLADIGFKVITFDFRDIGESKVDRMKSSKASFSVWALKDLKTVFEYSLSQRRTVVIGHSFGALAFTIQKRANEAVGLYGFGTGTGHISHMKFFEKMKALFLWHAIAPIAVYLKNYLPGNISGMGSHVPKGVYLEWKRWCSNKKFWIGDPGFKEYTKNLNTLCLPTIIVASRDDPWTPIESAKSYYSNFNKELTIFKEINSRERQVGHIGYFLEANKDLFWTDLVSWLKNL